MKCNSCGSEIDPKWKHAIENNLCPFCGKLILEERLKDLLSNAREILDELNENYKEEFIEWTKKNYNLVYYEDVKQVQKAEKIKTIEANMKGPSINDFLKRAEVKQTEKSEDDMPRGGSSGGMGAVTRQDKLKSLAKKVASASSEENIDVSQIISSEEELIPAGYSDLEKAKELISQTYGVSSDPDAEIIPDVVMNMAKFKNSPDYNSKDVFKLQQSYSKAQASKESIGGAPKKGSFSRA